MAKRVLVLTLCLLVLASLAVFGAKQPTTTTTGKVTKPATLDQERRNPISRYILTPTPKVFLPFTGDTVGFTWEDYWHNDGQRRQVAIDGIGNVHFDWAVANNTGDFSSLYYNFYDTAGTWYAAGSGFEVPGTGPVDEETPGGAKRSGVDLLPDDREVLFYRMYGNPIHSAISIEKATPGLAEFNWFDIPDSLALLSAAATWPYVCISKVKNGDTVYMHITGTHTGTAGAAYARCFLLLDTDTLSPPDTILKCQAPGSALTTTPPNKRKYPRALMYQFDPSRDNVTALPIATSPVSQNVAIAWHKQVGGSSQCELMYRESSNNGNDWIASGNMGIEHQITSYGLDGYKTNMLQTDQDVIYDLNGDLHIVWVTGTSTNADDATLWHWRKSDSLISKVTTNNQQNSLAFNRSINKPTLAVTSEDSDYLYVTYIKYNDNRLSANNNASGDLYLQASSTGGRSWGPPVNLSDTTDGSSDDSGCAPGNCKSEAYPTIALRDSTLYVFYLYDLDAGEADASVQVGTFTNNPARYIVMPRPIVPAVASIAFAPSQFTTPMKWAVNNGSTTDNIKFDNTGTTTLQVKLSGPSWLTAAPDSFSIPEFGATQTVTLTFNGSGYADTLLAGKLKIKSNNGVEGGGFNYNDSQYVDIHFVVTDTFYYAEYDTIDTGTDGIRMVISNVGTMGNESAGDSVNGTYHGRDYLFDGSVALLTTGSALGATDVYKHHDFLPEAPLLVAKVDTVGGSWWTTWGITITTAIYAPMVTRLSTPDQWFWWWWTVVDTNVFFQNEKVIVKYTKLYKNPPPKWWHDISGPVPPVPLPTVYFGLAGDLDASGSGSFANLGVADDAKNLIYLQGDSVGFTNDYSGIYFYYVKRNGDTTKAEPYGAHVLESAYSIHLNSNEGYPDDTLYKFMANTPGWTIPTDTVPHYEGNIVICADSVAGGGASTVVTAKYAFVPSDNGLVGLYKPMCGNANRDDKVSVSDIVYLVNFQFKGGPKPFMYYANANGDNKITVSDIVYLVNFQFKGGPKPVCNYPVILP